MDNEKKPFNIIVQLGVYNESGDFSEGHREPCPEDCRFQLLFPGRCALFMEQLPVKQKDDKVVVLRAKECMHAELWQRTNGEALTVPVI